MSDASPPTPGTFPPLASPAQARRQISVLFCDLVGSTALSSQMDPEDLADLIRDYQALCASAIQQLGGYVAQFLGDRPA